MSCSTGKCQRAQASNSLTLIAVACFAQDSRLNSAGGYNYIYSRRGHYDPALGIPKRHQPIPADLGFPIAIVAMLIGSLIALLHAIGRRLKVCCLTSLASGA